MIHTVKGFGAVSKAEGDCFLDLSCFSNDPVDVGDLISGSSAFSKSCLNIWKFTLHILLKPGLENFGHYFAGMWDKCSCVVVWTSLALPVFGLWLTIANCCWYDADHDIFSFEWQLYGSRILHKLYLTVTCSSLNASDLPPIFIPVLKLVSKYIIDKI